MTQQLSAGLVPQWTLGDRLRKARELTGLEAIQFADEIGVHRDTVANYEKGKITRPRRIVLQAWAMRTGVSLQWLSEGDPNPFGGATADASAENSRTSDQKVRGSSPFGRTTQEDVPDHVPAAWTGGSVTPLPVRARLAVAS